MSTAESPGPFSPGEPPRSSNNLAFLSQGVLTATVRLQAQRERMPAADTFRQRTKRSLEELEREARIAGYGGDDIKNAQFALVAFLDSVVLNSSEAGRAEWERQSLAMELFNVGNAGEIFFDKLDAVRGEHDSQRLADLLEVFLLCLLMGFEGRYAGGAKGELSTTIDKVRRRIDSIRGKAERLSPSGVLPDNVAPTPVMRVSSLSRDRTILLCVVCGTLILFVFLKLSLIWQAAHTLRSLAPL